jgi:pSer/pThr/pTyr-binding forkhead associated (FHA) protein
MTPTPIPAYPVIHVDVRADGSAHVNVAGQHVDYPAAPIADTRTAITQYAVDIAISLGRPVRMNTTEPAGTFTVAAHPDGTVSDLAAPEPITRRGRRSQRTPDPSTPEAPVETARDSADNTGESTVRRAPSPTVTLTLDNGQIIAIRGSALVGRYPDPGNDAIDHLIAIDDPERTLSKTHFRLHWQDSTLWITDCNSGNGTTVLQQPGFSTHLTPGVPHELRYDDVVQAGEVTFTVTLEHMTPRKSRS